MSKFKVGDWVTGTDGNTYGITNSKGIYEVVEIKEGYSSDIRSDIRIKVIDHKDSSNIGDKWDVISKYFILVED